MRNRKAWKTLSEKRVIDSPHLRIRDEVVQLPGGEVLDHYFINESMGWSCIFCVTVEGRVILNRQYKHGIGRRVLELPAGMIEPEETPLDCARRELCEETGYLADHFEHVRSFIIDPSGNTGMMHLFCCENARPARQKNNDPQEPIVNQHVAIDTLMDLVLNGEINVLGHVAAIYTMLLRKGVLNLART